MPDLVRSSRPGYAYEVTRGLYHTYFKTDITKPDAVLFETENGSYFRSGLKAMAYYDASSKKYQIISECKKPQKPLVDRSTITYTNVLPGVNVKMSYGDTRLKEEICLSQEAREKLPKPSTLGMKGGNVYLAFMTQFSADASVEVFAENVKIGGKD